MTSRRDTPGELALTRDELSPSTVLGANAEANLPLDAISDSLLLGPRAEEALANTPPPGTPRSPQGGLAPTVLFTSTETLTTVQKRPAEEAAPDTNQEGNPQGSFKRDL